MLKERWGSCSSRPSTSRILWQLTCVCVGGGEDWGVAGFYVVGTPGLFWGANTWHCFGLTCEDSKLKPSPGCNQRNRVHLKLFKHIHFPPGETCLPWHSIPATGLPWCGFWFLWLPLQLPAVFVLPLWFPLGDALKQLLGSDSAVVFSLLLPPENDQGGSYFSCTRWAEAYTPHSFSPCSECIPGVVCSAVHTCVSTHSEYIDSRELLGPSHQSPAFASLEPGCFQPGFSSIELSPALLPLLRTTWFLCSHLVLRQDM